ncbi:MAG: Stp1/IreP family PP2C-type Ser/Thr phosphatase [Egibacteraceae bacterium]
MKVRAYAGSDVGQVRQGNEDNLFAGDSVFAVADGMGGHVAGEIASETALEPIRELDEIAFRSEKAARQALADAITSANKAVVEKAEADPAFRGMGTTLTVALLREAKLHVAHVGDSRAYLLRDSGGLTQLTTDHTLVEQLIREGRLSRADAGTHPQRSVITRAIGIETTVEIDALPPLALQAGDQVLLCSDGLTGPVPDDQITELLTTIPDGDAACQALIDAANAAGGPDNITLVILRVQGEGDEAPPVPPVPAARVSSEDTTEEMVGVPSSAPDPVDRTAEAEGGVTQIRTRQESGRDWATSMRDYGASQGAPERAVRGSRDRRGMRLATGLIGLTVIAILVVGGAYVLLSRAWFVGDEDGAVAVFRGVPSEVAGLSLARTTETTDIVVAELPPRRAERVRQGVTFGSESEALDFVDLLRDEVVEEDGPDPDAADPDAADAPDPNAPDGGVDPPT